MDESQSLENSLFDTLTDSSLEIGGEIIELTIDQFIDNDLLKEIPFFSIFYKSLKTVQGVRDALFAMKVYKFIAEFNSIKQNERDNFSLKISTDKKERIKVGQTLIMILDKIDDLDKTQIIANLFAAYIKSEITKSEFVQMCSVVQNSYLEYLITFSKFDDYRELPLEIQNNLGAIGLMNPFITDLRSMYGSSYIIEKNDYLLVYVPSKIGGLMKKYAFKVMPSS